MKIAVVILNWNGRNLLEKFLPGVVKFSKEATVYVADNASTDDSVSFVSAHFPSVKIIQNSINGGYAKGYNDALRLLEEDIFVLLNSDVEVTEDWLFPVISKFSEDSAVGAAQPKILDLKRPEYFEYAGAAGGFIDKYGFPYCRGRIFNTLEEDKGQYDEDCEVFWASGACLFIRSSVFKEMGGFDEDFFAHQEEIDLCWRIRSSGKKILAVGSSRVYHLGGATLEASHPRKTYLNFRNSLFNLVKNAERKGLFLTIFIRLCLDGLAGIHFLFQGKPRHTFSIIRAHFSFYRHLPNFIKKRTKTDENDSYYQIKSIVYQYYIRKKKTFNKL